MATPASQPARSIRTVFLIISDTHGFEFNTNGALREDIDVAIHCGDLTKNSRLDEFRKTIQVLNGIKAALKLIIPGNHDFTLDRDVYAAKTAEACRIDANCREEEVREVFGAYGASRKLLHDAEKQGILFLDEGTHQFHLENGAILNVYASAYTPSNGGEWGFQYNGQHAFDIPQGIDIVITHGPPLGLLDKPPGREPRIGCAQLFGAIARSQPRLHCFGHCHNGWGAKLVTWRTHISDAPCHFVDIDNTKSRTIASLNVPGSPTSTGAAPGYRLTGLYNEDGTPLPRGQTMFVNAALMGNDHLDQLPWVVALDLQAHSDSSPDKELADATESE